MSVLNVLEALFQLLPLAVYLIDTDLIVELFTIARQVEGLDSASDASDGEKIAAVTIDAPDLRRAVVGRLLLALALAAAEEVDHFPVGGPARKGVVGPVECQPADLLAVDLDDPEIGLTVVG